MDEELIDSVYLPFPASTLSQHFAPVQGGTTDETDKHLVYFLTSASRYRAHRLAPKATAAVGVQKLPRQIEKDERFWAVAAFMSLYHDKDRVERFAKLLSLTFGEKPPLPKFSRWADCLDGDLRLYFEANLPSPVEYRRWLRDHLRDRHFVPYIFDAAQGVDRLEGPTHVDALIVNPGNGFAWAIEAKALSDISYQVTFDALRNQIARNIDVLLDANPKLLGGLEHRRPDSTLFTLLTPQMFKQPDNQHSRLYGWLMREYMTDPTAIQRDLPHRANVDWPSVSRRLGWATFEDCERVLPGACRWLAL